MISRIIRCIIGFLLICFIQFACNFIVKTANIMIPSPILGIILLSFLIHINVIKKEWVKDICDLLLKYMPLLFVPIFVGIISYYEIIQKNLIPILINIIITTTLTILITALFVENVIKYIRLKKFKETDND